MMASEDPKALLPQLGAVMGKMAVKTILTKPARRKRRVSKMSLMPEAYCALFRRIHAVALGSHAEPTRGPWRAAFGQATLASASTTSILQKSVHDMDSSISLEVLDFRG